MSEVFDGTVDIQNSSGGNTTLTLHGDLGQIVVFVPPVSDASFWHR